MKYKQYNPHLNRRKATEKYSIYIDMAIWDCVMDGNEWLEIERRVIDNYPRVNLMDLLDEIIDEEGT